MGGECLGLYGTLAHTNSTLAGYGHLL